MALEGLLQEFGLADILQLIYFQKKTGILNIEGKHDKVELSFVKGNIAGLKSFKKVEANRLGRVLVKKGLITEDQLKEAIQVQTKEGTKIGNFFVKKDLVPKETLIEVIQEQIIESIVQIFSWKEGKYEFLPRGIPIDKDLPIYLDTQHLLMDGLKMLDEWSLIEGKLDFNTVFKRIGMPDPEELSDVEKEVLLLIDGDRDAITIIQMSDTGDYETAQAIIALREKQVIEPLDIRHRAELTESVEKKLTKVFPFAFYGIMAIIFIVMVKGNFDTFSTIREAKTSFHVERTKNIIDIHYVEHSEYPDRLESISPEVRDPWGRPYVYKLTPDGFILFSAGPDGLEGTEDDVY